MKTFKISSFLIFIHLIMFGQTKNDFLEINKQIWEPFSQAYAMKDISLFGGIHHEDFIRVSGNNKSIKDKSKYINQLAENWTDDERTLKIEFRFTERISSEGRASERGIYKLTVTTGINDPQFYFGKFHVILTKETKWKLLMDYDSNEYGTIGKEDFLAANDINRY